MNSKDGLFSIILALLDEVFREKDSGDNNDQNGFDSMMNFHQFEKVESGKSCVSRRFVTNCFVFFCFVSTTFKFHYSTPN